MLITRKFKVSEVRFTSLRNAPFILTLEPGDVLIGEPSSATLGKNNRLFIGDIEPSLLGREIEITLRPELNLPERVPELLVATSLTKTERVTFREELGENRVTVNRLLVLATEVKVGAHPTPTPCPYYKFNLRLTEKEYQAIKLQPNGTVFSAWGVLL